MKAIFLKRGQLIKSDQKKSNLKTGGKQGLHVKRSPFEAFKKNRKIDSLNLLSSQSQTQRSFHVTSQLKLH